jgi:hypothetical protein
MSATFCCVSTRLHPDTEPLLFLSQGSEFLATSAGSRLLRSRGKASPVCWRVSQVAPAGNYGHEIAENVPVWMLRSIACSSRHWRPYVMGKYRWP